MGKLLERLEVSNNDDDDEAKTEEAHFIARRKEIDERARKFLEEEGTGALDHDKPTASIRWDGRGFGEEVWGRKRKQ